MTEFIRCLIYLAVTGIIGFVTGRILPKKWFSCESAPWRQFGFEKDGKIYSKLKVKSWQKKVPDMSRIFQKLMPAKSIGSACNKEIISLMIKETCVAELVHVWLCVCAINCIRIWPGIGGIIVALLYILGNLPFIIIQRFNRPRLEKLLYRFQLTESSSSPKTVENSELSPQRIIS